MAAPELEQAADGAFITSSQVDEDGLRWVEWDYEDDAANEAVDSFYDELFAAELAGLSAEEVAEIQADEDALAAFLDERGIAYERVSLDPITVVEWDYDDDANDAVDQFYFDRYGEDVDGDLEDE